MELITNKTHRLDVNVIPMLASYVAEGGTPVRKGGDIVSYPFDAAGELTFTQAQYDFLDLIGVGFEKAFLYTAQPAGFLDLPVPTIFPDSTITDSSGSTVARLYGDYFQWYDLLDDGTYLVRMVHAPVPSVKEGEGLSDIDRKAFQAEFGNLIVRSDADALKPVPVEVVV